MITLPFSIPKDHQKFTTTNGILRGDSAGLTFEYQTALFSLVKSNVKSIHVPVRELEEVELDNGWFRTGLAIRARSMRSISQLPGSSSGQIYVTIPRRYRAEAAQLCAELALGITEQRLAETDADILSSLEGSL